MEVRRLEDTKAALLAAVTAERDMLSQLVTQFNEPVRAVESIDPAADTDEFAAVTETKIAYVIFFSLTNDFSTWF